ncbi:M16 family metallopeptidase [Holophaga foetida]|uniref:M16 family metallopeptidase n=1 Tax=Holophaga foetida TaxID=35839 RepID=UPI00024753BC|nr:insulinase family protein [Holophaga foetida]
MKRLIPALLLVPGLMAAQSQEQSFTLPNGLRVVVLEDHALPQVRVHLALDFEARGGLAPITGALMEGSGAGPLNADAFARALEERGAWLHSFRRPGTLEWRLQVGSPELEGALELLGHTVFRPVYDASRVERLRGRMLRQAQERSLRESTLDLFLGALGHPDGGVLPPEAALRRITFQELSAFRRGISDPRRAVVVLQGDVSLSLAHQVMLQNFGTWTPPSAPSHAEPEEVPTTLQVSGFPPECWAGRRIVFADEAEREAFDVLTEVFARRASSETLRLEWVRGDQRAGVMLAWAPASQTVIMERLGAMALQGLTQAELDQAREARRRQRAMLALHPKKLVEGCLDRHRVPRNGPVEAFRLAQVQSLLTRWLRPEGLRFLVVTNEK